MKIKPPFKPSTELVYSLYGEMTGSIRNIVVDSDLNIVARTPTRAMAQRIAKALNKVEGRKSNGL
jgi:hypothetical protein